MSLRTRLATLALGAFCPLASAFLIPVNGAPPADTVVEYFNTGTGHYFYTWSTGDQQALASGAFGAGWVQTGAGFGAYGTRDRGRNFSYTLDACSPQGACLPISRFYAPGPNSHFFTGSAGDVAILDRPGTGWLRENIAFYTAMPDAAGNCSPDKTPVHRLYNNRAAQNDSNHRYTADDAARRVMVARGWIDEGVAFCAYGKRALTVATYGFAVSKTFEVMDIRDCRAEPDAGSCLGVTNLPRPSHPFTSNSSSSVRDEFDLQTGMFSSPSTVTMAVAGGSRLAAAADAFVQLSPTGEYFSPSPSAGIHVATQSRIGAPYAGITALRRLPHGSVRPYGFDTGTDHELYLRASVYVQEANAPAGSHAYGVFTLQFTDETSGRSLLFNMLAFGTLPAGEGAARDIHTSLPLVYATFGNDGRFGKLWGTTPYAIPQRATPLPGLFLAWIKRRHFEAILDSARQVDPALSPRPEDYFVANFGLVNETYGEGEIGVVVNEITLSVKGAE